MNDFHSKEKMRKRLKLILSSLIMSRRKTAESSAFVSLLPEIKDYHYVLSFVSMREELSTKEINLCLANRGQLVLPKIAQEKLELYLIKDPLSELISHPTYSLYEPDPSRCIQINPRDISFALIPGLGFDKQFNRLGHGKGYYDRLIPQLSCQKLGLGFFEQLVDQTLPIEPHDKAVDGLALY